MSRKDTRIAVIGAGAIGGITAGFMTRAGYNVEVACKHQELADKIRSRGLHIFGVKGDYRVSMPAVAKISELSGPKDIVLLAVKATDTLDAAKEVVPFLLPASIVIPMQNGMCAYTLAEIFGPERTVGCVIGWGATMHGPGELEMTAVGGITIGALDNRPDPRFSELKKILSVVVPLEISENIKGNLYFKLIVNSCINSVGVICGLCLGKMLAVRKIRNIFIGITHEAVAVAEAMGVKVEVYAGKKIDYYKFFQGSGFFKNFKLHFLMRLIGFKYRRVESSNLQSLKRGKATEIDFLNGYISLNGKRHNIPTPVNDKIVEMVKDIEAGRKKVGFENLNDPFFAKFK